VTLPAKVTDPVAVVVMTRPACAGQVKTRLTAARGGGLSDEQAAAVHAAMSRCVLARLSQLPGIQGFIAVDGGRLNPPGALPVAAPGGWSVLDQGPGDLGQRLGRVWQSVGGGPIAFFGVDSPDVPGPALTAAIEAARAHDAAAGPVDDGGYWTLAAVRYRAGLLAGIDWGTQRVYHQTSQAARRLGLTLHALPAWHDVDGPADLAALQRRLASAEEPMLRQLRDELQPALRRPSQGDPR